MRMRVLLLTDDYLREDSVGGGDVVTQHIAAGLMSRGHCVGICCSMRTLGEQKPKGLELFTVLCPKSAWRSRRLFAFYGCALADRFNVMRVIARFRPDVVYCLHQRGIAVPTISFVNSLPVPLVYRIGDEWLRLHYYADKYDVENYWPRSNRHSLRRLAVCVLAGLAGGNTGLLSRPDFLGRFVVFNTTDLARRVTPFIKGDCQARVIKNGVNLDSFYFCHRREPSSPPRLLYVGRLVGHKGVHLLPEMMIRLHSTRHLKGSTLTIVGWSDDVPYIDSLRRRVIDLGLSAHVRLIGPLPQSSMPRCYSEHDILVFPTPTRPSCFTVEGCPTVLIEAMACGLPIVARMTPGVDETVKNGETCIGVYEDSSEALAGAVIRLCSDNGLFDHLSVAGRRHAETEHSLECMVRQTESFLASVVGISQERRGA